MTFPLPINGSNQLKEVPNSLAQQKEMEKKSIAKVAQDSLRQQLPIEPKKWSIWSLFGYKKKEEAPSEQRLVLEERDHSAQEEMLEEGESPEEFKNPPIILKQEPEENEEDGEGFVILDGDDVAFFDRSNVNQNPNNQPTDLEQDEIKKERVEKTAEKTAVVHMGFFKRIGGGVAYLGERGKQKVKEGVQWYVGGYGEALHKDKDALINNAKQSMLADLNDPQFVEFYEFINTLLWPPIEGEILNLEAGFIRDNLLPQMNLIHDLLSINLAKGFANLARQVRQHQETHPNLKENKQSSMLSVLSLFSEKASVHINTERLSQLEEKYRDSRSAMQVLTKKLFPAIDTPEEEKTRALIQKGMQTNAPKELQKIIDSLFPDLREASEERKQDIEEFKRHLSVLVKRHREFKELFTFVADDILVYFFPNKVQDLEVLEVAKRLFIPKLIYNRIQRALSDTLQDFYDPLENDLNRVQGWENDLKQQTGIKNLDLLTHAPSALLTGMAKHFIQSDSRAIDLVAQGIDAARNPKKVNLPENRELTREEWMAKLTQDQLANWFVETAQGMLNNTDSRLVGLGQFIQRVFNNLVLAVLAKGTSLVIPKDEKIEENQFVKKLIDKIVVKFKSGQLAQEMSDEVRENFVRDFVKDLPLPLAIKELLVKQLIQQSKVLKEALQENAPLQKVQEIYEETEKKILAYTGGQEFLGIIETFSNQIVESTLKENIGLVSEEMGDWFEELFAQYLPGITIDEDFKKWFKENISALQANEEGVSPESTKLIKQGIQTVLGQAVIHLIETNIQNGNEDYAAQLLEKIQQAFEKAFMRLSDPAKHLEYKQKFKRALEIQAEIRTRELVIEKLNKEIIQKPKDLTPEQQALIQEVIHTNACYIEATNNVNRLKAKIDESLAKLNADALPALLNEAEGVEEGAPEGNSWTCEHLPRVSQALMLHKIYGSPRSSDDYIQSLNGKSDELKQAISPENPSEENNKLQEEFEQHEILISLMEEPLANFEIISELARLEATLQHATREQQSLKLDLDAKEKFIDALRVENEAWDNAKNWMEKKLKCRQFINEVNQGIVILQKDLNTNLEEFQILSHELFALFGLDQNKEGQLTGFIKEKVGSYIELAKNQALTPALFKQLLPMMMPILDISENREKLKELSKENHFIAQLISTGAESAINYLPALITPEEIAEALKDVIPDATNLRTLIALQLQAMMTDQNEVFQKNRNFMQQYIEGMLLRIFVKIAESNHLEGRDILDVMTEKLEKLSSYNERLKDQSAAEVVQVMINDILEDIFGIKVMEEDLGFIPQKDLEGIPLALQKMVYEKLRKQAHLRLTPLMLPIVERKRNREILEAKSGSAFMGSLCEAASKDIFYLLPQGVRNYQPVIVASLNQLLPNGSVEFQQAFAKELEEMINANSPAYQNISGFAQTYAEGVLIKLFIRIAEKNPPVEGKDSFVVLTENLLELAKRKYLESKESSYEEMAQEFKEIVMGDLLGIDSPAAFEGLLDPLKVKVYETIKDQLGEVLNQMHAVLKGLEDDNLEVQQAREDLKRFGIDDAGKSYAEILINKLVNKSLMTIPQFLIENTGKGNKRGVIATSAEVNTYLEELARGHLQIAKEVLNYAQAPKFQEMLGDHLEEIANREKLVEDKKQAAHLLSNLIAMPLNEVLQKAIKFEEEKTEDFTKKLMTSILQVVAGHLQNLNEAREIAKGKGRLEVFHEDLVEAADRQEGGLHRAVPKTQITYHLTLDEINRRLPGKFTEEQQKELRQAIIQLAKEERCDRAQVLSLEAIIAEIHQICGLTNNEREALAVPNEQGLTLKDLIRQEAMTHKTQRRKEFYEPALKVILKMITPPKELRGQPWKIFKKKLAPLLVPLITELLLEPDSLQQIILTLLGTVRDSLLPLHELTPKQLISLYKRGKLIIKSSGLNANEVLGKQLTEEQLLEKVKKGEVIAKPDQREPKDRELDEMDQVAGELMKQAFKMVKLPSWAKKMVIDPQTGNVSNAMKKTLGAVLRRQLPNFFKEKLELALEKGSQLDLNRPRQEVNIQPVLKEIVDNSPAFFIRNQWQQAQERFDKLVERVLGKVGLKLKAALDAVFRFVFFKIVGTILSFLFKHTIQNWVKERIYRLVYLDENGEMLLSLTKRPIDQPREAKHIVYHEDLVYKVLEAAIHDFLEQPMFLLPQE